MKSTGGHSVYGNAGSLSRVPVTPGPRWTWSPTVNRDREVATLMEKIWISHEADIAVFNDTRRIANPFDFTSA